MQLIFTNVSLNILAELHLMKLIGRTLEEMRGHLITITNVNADRLTNESDEYLITENIVDTEYLTN